MLSYGEYLRLNFPPIEIRIDVVVLFVEIRIIALIVNRTLNIQIIS